VETANVVYEFVVVDPLAQLVPIREPPVAEYDDCPYDVMP
jgi:hypothetical protein